jgi:hypothetical protein
MQPPRLQPAGHFIAEQPNYFRKTGSAAHFQPSDRNRISATQGNQESRPRINRAKITARRNRFE